MKRLNLTLLFFLIGIAATVAQKQIKGQVKDTYSKPITGANVSLKNKESKILIFTKTDENGNFTLSYSDDTKIYSIEVSIIGFEKQTIVIVDLTKSLQIIMRESNINLKTVVVKNKPALTLKGDTLNYKTSDFADKQDRTIGDVLKKMPGITVEEDGKVSYNGKGISNLYIDGDNVLNDRYNIGTKSITHGVVDKVQVIEKDQPIKMLRKNNTSEDVALNLVIKDEAKLKIMGDIKPGLGTPKRYDGEANAMMFKKNFKFINNIKGNNIGVDPAIDLTSHNLSNYLKRLENNKPSNFLSAGAAGVPTLPQSRTLFNNAALINLNNLYKFNPDLQLRANISYVHDKREQIYNKLSETYLQNQTITFNESQVNHIRPQKLQAEFNLNENTENHYLNNSLIANYSPTLTNSAVVINGIAAQQSLHQQQFDLSNELSYRKKLKSDNILNFYSYFNKSTQPETLNIKPGLNEEILNSSNSFAALDQYIELPSWFTNNFISFAIVKNKITQTFKTGFNYQKQDLNSTLYKTQNNQTVELVGNNMSNDLNWTKNKIYAETALEYTSEKFKVGLFVPLSYNSIRYNDLSKTLNKNLQKVFFNPRVSVTYQTSVENYITANYSLSNDLGGLDDIYQGTILKNYRSLFANNAPLTERKTHSISTGFNYKKAIQMLFINFNASYNNSTQNTISSYVLTNNTQQRIVLPLINDMQSLTLSANMSKYLFNWRSTVNFGINFSLNKFDQLQNGELMPFNTNTINYKAGLDSKLNNFLNWSYSVNYTLFNNKIANSGIRNNNEQLNQKTGLTGTAFKSLFINLSAEHIFTKQSLQPYLNYLFADLNVRYKFIKLKTDLEFGVTNLTNIKNFEAINLSANAFTSGTYYIPGRVAMFKATFNF